MNALLFATKVKRQSLKVILKRVAFFFYDGPWRSLWIKYGYDPRQDPASRFYQILDFRIRRSGKNRPSARPTVKGIKVKYQQIFCSKLTASLTLFAKQNSTTAWFDVFKSHSSPIFVILGQWQVPYFNCFRKLCRNNIQHKRPHNLIALTKKIDIVTAPSIRY